MDEETEGFVQLLMDVFTITMTERMDGLYTISKLTDFIVNSNISLNKKETISAACFDAISLLDVETESVLQMKNIFRADLVSTLEARMPPPAQNTIYGI